MKFNINDAITCSVFVLLIAVSFCFTNQGTLAFFQSQSNVGEANLKKWAVKVNGTNIVYRNKFRLDAVYNSTNASSDVKEGVIAPGATFDVPVLIDASKSEVDVKYMFALDSNNTQFEIIDTTPATKEVTAGSTENAVVTIKWKGTGNVSDDINMQGKNIDVPLVINARQLTS